MHYLLAALFTLHGFAHLAGLATTWCIGAAGRASHSTTILAGRVDLGESGIRALGLWWVACALSFIAAGALVLLGQHASFATALASATVSAVLCLLFWPATRIGLVVDLAIIAIVIFRPGAGG